MGGALDSDILIPKLRFGGDEVAHELDAGRVLADFNVNALGADVFFGALEGYVFANDDTGDFVEEGGAAAHGTGGKGGVEGAALINGSVLAAGILEAVHLGMMDNAAMLDALVVAAADDLPVADKH